MDDGKSKSIACAIIVYISKCLRYVVWRHFFWSLCKIEQVYVFLFFPTPVV
jgi:hypothetical protein